MSLTVCSQTEFANANVPDIPHGILDSHATVPDFHDNISNTGVPENRHDQSSTPTVVPGAHHDITFPQLIDSEVQGGLAEGRTAVPVVLRPKTEHRGRTDDQNRPVSTTPTLSVIEWSLIL